MAFYVFGIHQPGEFGRDKTGTDCAGREEIQQIAMEVFPTLAKVKILKDGDRQAFTALIRGAQRHGQRCNAEVR